MLVVTESHFIGGNSMSQCNATDNRHRGEHGMTAYNRKTVPLDTGVVRVKPKQVPEGRRDMQTEDLM